MRAAFQTIAWAALAAMTAGSVAIAAEPAKRSASAKQRQDAPVAASRAAASTPSAIGGAVAPGVRLAALVDQGGGVIRSKGVARVTRPSTGRYCIYPASGSGVSPSNVVPVVSVDYSNSSVHESLVQYRSAGVHCPSTAIAVVTMADLDLDGVWGFSNTVAFTIIVP
jgi:hypothetical protein